jgi:hypothetical protein
MLDSFREYQQSIADLEREVTRLRAATVTREALLQAGQQIVDDYFRHTRIQLLGAGVVDEELHGLDNSLQQLLEATHRRTPTRSFRKIIKETRNGCFDVEKRLLARAGAPRAVTVGDAVDNRIIDTLKALLPSAALAYEQGLIDLSAADRLSWRGPATDFREALRETLDHLAPDKGVMAQPGYKSEPNTSGPTMKQKVRYVLRQRSKGKMIVDSSEAAVEAVDAIMGTFVRSVYTRSSVSTHTATGRNEVIRVRDFVRLALCELLEIHVE